MDTEKPGLERLQSVERRLTTLLAGWAAGSAAVGSFLVIAGHRSQREELTRFGRQTLAWGAVDGVIAGVGVLSRRRRGDLSAGEVTRKERSLRRLLLVNAAADIAYVAAGFGIAVRGRGGRTTVRLGTGDGLAIAIQGAFLLALDTAHAMELEG